MRNGPTDLSLETLHAGYRTGSLTPLALIEALLDRLTQPDTHHIWISRVPPEQLRAHAARLAGRDISSLPLYGIPFAIKDNIDLHGLPTTAACPAFAYEPARNATVVQRLLDAGAIPLGKTNMDQFATGLNGTRSPYGICRNAVDARYISGGSSSGSALAVALGLASFALGTDTAGSGRVPAALNNLIGHKPSLGVISSDGVVPACQSLDTVSIFSLNARDAERVLAVAAAPDHRDPYSRPLAPYGFDFGRSTRLRIGVPRTQDLEFFGDSESERQFDAALRRLRENGASLVPVDFSPFLETARMLYQGPWLSERYLSYKTFLSEHPEAVLDVTRTILLQGEGNNAIDLFTTQHRLQALRKICETIWHDVDVLVTPTVGTPYTIDEILEEPVVRNANLGYYTNFVNLLDLAATAVPAGRRSDGLPFGVTLIAQRDQDAPLLHLADRLHRACDSGMGAARHTLPRISEPLRLLPSGQVRCVVLGAHLSGLAMNHQLTELGARLISDARTAATYRLFALNDGLRPGLVRVTQDGASIACELWEMSQIAFGQFVDGIAPPLAMGSVELSDGTTVHGFICEAAAVASARDITALGGWRAWLDARQ